MKVKIGAVVVAITIVVSVIVLASDNQSNDSDTIFHVTLANPELYIDGVFVDEFLLDPGEYRFRFTPNGDSPEVLSIRIEGGSFLFEEDYKLKGTLHKTEISEYHTWEYLGENNLVINNPQTIEISIDPNGNLLGPVSVSLLRE